MAGITAAIILSGLISIASIACWILLGVWTYRDAQNKGMVGILWTAVVLLVPGMIGLIIYLIVRMDNNKVICSRCNVAVDGNNRYCSNCGAELVPAQVSEEKETAFKKTQRNILIGFFSSLAAIVIFGIFMIVSLVTGVLRITEDAVKWVSSLPMDSWEEALEDTLGDIDVLFDQSAIHIQVQDDRVSITDKDGNNLVDIDGKSDSVDVDLQKIRELLDQYDIEYRGSMDEKELEEEIRRQLNEELRDVLDDYYDD